MAKTDESLKSVLRSILGGTNPRETFLELTRQELDDKIADKQDQVDELVEKTDQARQDLDELRATEPTGE